MENFVEKKIVLPKQIAVGMVAMGWFEAYDWIVDISYGEKAASVFCLLFAS